MVLQLLEGSPKALSPMPLDQPFSVIVSICKFSLGKMILCLYIYTMGHIRCVPGGQHTKENNDCCFNNAPIRSNHSELVWDLCMHAMQCIVLSSEHINRHTRSGSPVESGTGHVNWCSVHSHLLDISKAASAAMLKDDNKPLQQYISEVAILLPYLWKIVAVEMRQREIEFMLTPETEFQ